MTPNDRRYRLRNPQAVAWVVLLAGFAMFCAICVAGTAGARWFLFESQVDMNVHLTVSRGRVDLQLPASVPFGVSQDQAITTSAALDSDSASQGYLTLEDSYSKQVVATVYLLQESTVSLVQSARPRFEWSGDPYRVRFTDAAGRFVVEIPPGLKRSLALIIQSPLGEARFSGSGTFRLDIVEQQIRLQADAGQAILADLSGVLKRVDTGMVGALKKDTQGATAASVSPLAFDVLNAGFGDPDDIQTNPALPIGWACTSEANKQNEPQGNVARVLSDNQVVLRMARAGEGLNHAESRCIYTFGPIAKIPQDVSGYTSLAIRARMRILSQDVTTCGILGSECPIMLELEYQSKDDPSDQSQFWRHGFYAVRPATDDSPLFCDTCLQEHEKLNQGIWYLYDSGDLFKLLPENRRPAKIIRLKIYSSGHAYEALVTDLAVIAGEPETAP